MGKKTNEKNFSPTYSRDDEFSGQKTDGWKGAVCEQRDGSERVNDGVNVSQSLQPF
jgi:hypothetical protein